MKRDLSKVKRMKYVSGCCPGHDQFPDSTYRSRRSVKARSRGIKVEHQYARSLLRDRLNKEVKEVINEPDASD